MKIFEKRKLMLDGIEISFDSLEWNSHPSFEGVELKHLIRAKDTNGIFSYHLVKIKPNKKIGLHIHQNQLETHEIIEGNGMCKNGNYEYVYDPGVISIFEAGVEHEIIANEKGLYLFATFIPALC